MRIPPSLAAPLAAALLALSPGLFPARADAQVTCTSRTDCVEKGIPFTNQPPGLSFGGPADTVYEARQEVDVFVADAWGLDEYSRTFTISGGTLLSGPGWRWNKVSTSAWITSTVQLAPGPNTLQAKVCDLTGKCTTGTRQVVYTVPPPPPSRAPAALRAVLNGDNRNLATCDGCAEAVLQYTTPEYVSRDQSRSMTLFYSTHQARPMGYVEVEATDNSPQPAAKFSIQVIHPNGSAITPETFDSAGPGPQRLAASWDAAGYGTGALVYTVVVRSYWNDGGVHTAQIPVRVPIVNETGSRYGSGWTLAGVGRVHPQADGALVTDGEGGVLWFGKGSCTDAANCSYQSPVGEESSLRMISGWFQRDWPDGRIMQYHATGVMANASDRFGNQTVLYYDASVTQLQSISDPAGMVTTFTWYPGGYLRSIKDPAGREAIVGYNYADLAQVWDPDGRITLQPVYDGVHRVTGWTDARGGVWNVTYDGASRVQRIEGPAVTDGGTTARATTTVRSREAALLPPAGMGTSATPAPRRVADHAALEVTDASGTTRVWADGRGLATRVQTSAGTVRYRRNANGQLLGMDDAEGNTITFEYQSVRPYAVKTMQTVGADGYRVWTYEYGVYGALDRVLDTDGPVVDHVLDGMGRRMATLHDADTVAVYTYDAAGRVLTSRDAQGHTTTYTYQPAGTTGNLATVVSDGVTTERRYDALGRLVRTVSGGTAGDSVAYDLMNRVSSQTGPAGTTRFGFAVNGVDLDDVVDPLSQRYQFRHNVVGWVTQEIDPGWRTDNFGYDPATGAVRTSMDHRGNIVTFTRDGQGRPLTRTADGATTTWRYAPDGRWMVVSSPASYDSINYDSEGKVARTVTRRGTLELSVNHTYDAANRPDSVIVAGPWGSSASVYVYDRFGRMDGIRDATGRWTEIFYNREGLADSIRFPTTDTARTLFRYNARHQLSSTLSELPNQTRAYGYALSGLTLRDSVSAGLVGWEHQYGYDALQRVNAWELHKFGRKRVCYNIRDCATIDTDSLAQSLSFSWDAIGNPAAATREAGNRIRAHGGFSFDYDADGNLTRKYNASGFDQYFTWNALGQLTGVGRTGIGWVTYDYDGLGRRVRRVDQNTGAVVHYLYDGDDLVAEVDGAGNRLREYTYFPGIDRPHTLRQWAGGAGGAIYYYQLQKPGHVAGLVSTTRQLVNEYRYTPFGTPVNGFPVEGTTNPLQYMARELDSTTGLYYVRARWYDPQQGRFVSEDPMGLAAGFNQYAYVGDNPVSFRDPTGLCHTGGGVLSAGYSTGRLGNGSGYWEFWHQGELYHGHHLGQNYIICEPVPTMPGSRIGGVMPGGGNSGLVGSGNGGPAFSPPAPASEWAKCGASAAELAISGTGDALFFTGVGVAFKGVRLYQAGRAGITAVRTNAVRTGRGALLRQSNKMVRAGESMFGVGANEAALGYVGGLEADAFRAIGTGDTRWWTLLPGVGTIDALIQAWGACAEAISKSF